MKKDVLLNKLLVGMIILFPILISIYLTVWIFKLLLSIINITNNNDSIFSSIIIIFTFLAIFLLTGILASTKKGEKIIIKLDMLMMKIPLISKLYIFFKQLIETIYFKKIKSYKKVVIVEYPQENNYAIGFLTSETPQIIDDMIGINCFNIFIPTTPNPTSGMLILFPENKVRNINMSIEDALKYVISGGLAINRFKMED